MRSELSDGYAKPDWDKSPIGAEYEHRPYEWYEVLKQPTSWQGADGILERLPDWKANLVLSALLRLSRDEEGHSASTSI